jgi:tetratricopeptide (TPR) repeat protein
MENPISISPKQQWAAAELVRNFYAENGYVFSELVSVLMPGVNEEFAIQIADDINYEGIVDEAYDVSVSSYKPFLQNLAHSSPFTARSNHFLPNVGYSGVETAEFLRDVCAASGCEYPLDSLEPAPNPQIIIGALGAFSSGSLMSDWLQICRLKYTPCDNDLFKAFNDKKDAQSCEEGIKAASGCLDYIENNFETRSWQTAYYYINNLFKRECDIPPELSKMFEETLIKDLALFAGSAKFTVSQLTDYYFATGQPLKAIPYIKYFIDALVPKGGSYISHFKNLLGIAYYKTGEYRSALAVFKMLTEADKSNRPLIYYNIAACYAQLKDYDNALAYLEAIKEPFNHKGWLVDVKDEDSWIEFNDKFGNMYEAGNYKAALVYALKAVLLKWFDDALQYNIGLSYHVLGFEEKAVPYLERAIKLNPAEKNSWDELGLVYLSGKRYQDAIKAFKRAIELDPKYGWAHRNLGASYYGNGEYDKALKEHTLAVKYAGDDGDLKASALSSLGEAYVAQQEGRENAKKAEKPKKIKKPQKKREIEWYYKRR